MAAAAAEKRIAASAKPFETVRIPWHVDTAFERGCLSPCKFGFASPVGSQGVLGHRGIHL